MKRLLFIGDSLTSYFDWQRRFREYDVVNAGASGEQAGELLERLDMLAAEVPSADFVFLMTGINDILSEDFAIVDTYRDIVKRLRLLYPKALTVVQSILPVDLPWIYSSIINEINHSISTVAAEAGAVFLDLYQLFVDDRGVPKPAYLDDDGVHLTNRGYAIWSAEVEALLGRPA